MRKALHKGLSVFLVTISKVLVVLCCGCIFAHAEISREELRSEEFIEDILQRARTERWFDDKQWLRLVQYRRSFLGYKSLARSDKFFLSEIGEHNPESELYATIRELIKDTKKIRSRDGAYLESVRCVFPARKIWLEQKMGAKLSFSQCERYDRFIEILQPRSLTYVFSSYFLNNPASAFGHTFLRINKLETAHYEDRHVLSDYGVGYAAVKISENPFVYSVLGVSGYMPGAFDINPYYYKVREYNDFESRDLWEYDLNLSPEEVQLVVAYIWELLDVSFDYSYFRENCSYMILSILEAAKPTLNLLEDLKMQVMPADTVKTISRETSLVKSIHFRPSIRAVFEKRYEHLTRLQQKRIDQFAKNESIFELLNGLEIGDQRKVLDASIDYLDARYPKEIFLQQEKYFFKKNVLSRRAELGGITEPLQFKTPEGDSPHESHGSRRVDLGYSHRNSNTFGILGFKLSLHDLLDPSGGYPPSAQITMGYLSLDVSSEGKQNFIDVNKFILYEVVSLSRFDAFTDGFSWRLKFSNEKGRENNCRNQVCRWNELSGGIGVTFFVNKLIETTVWLRITSQVSKNFFEDIWRIGGGPAILLRYNLGNLSLLAESYYRYDYKGFSSEFRQNVLGSQITFNKSVGLRLNYEESNFEKSSTANLVFYY